MRSTGSPDQPALAHALGEGVVVLDGGLATQLEARGHDLSSDLWSARLLLEQPAEVTAAHRDFFARRRPGGDDRVVPGLVQRLRRTRHGRRRHGSALRRSVELAAAARDDLPADRPRWVAASVGPYGAALADGSEYRGDYGRSVAELRDWHRPRLHALMDTDADVLALETIPCLAEVEALLAEVSGTGAPCWLSLTCADGRTRAGEPLGEAFAMAAEVDGGGGGGCQLLRPGDVAAALAAAVTASGRPAVAYPNSGESWDAEQRRWSGDPTFTPGQVATWLAAGARLVGGCCRVGPGCHCRHPRRSGSAGCPLSARPGPRDPGWTNGVSPPLFRHWRW